MKRLWILFVLALATGACTGELSAVDDCPHEAWVEATAAGEPPPAAVGERTARMLPAGHGGKHDETCTVCHLEGADVGPAPVRGARLRNDGHRPGPCTGCGTTTCGSCHTADEP
jgi:hypothetical protein